MADKEIKGWITVNGKHIPIYEGETQNDAFNRAVKEKVKQDEEKKNADIKRNTEEAEKLNSPKKEVKQPTSKAGDKSKIAEQLKSKEANSKNEKWLFKEMSKAIDDKSFPEDRSYWDIPDEFADHLFDKYDPADLYIYLTQTERKNAYKDMKGYGQNSKQIQMEWKKKAIWRIAKQKAWDDLEEW